MNKQYVPSSVFCHRISADGSLIIKVVQPLTKKKIWGVRTLAVALVCAALLLEGTVRVAVATPPAGIKNVVLVHGAFADGSGWKAVVKILEKDGYIVSVIKTGQSIQTRSA
jgi:hypothetical protein